MAQTTSALWKTLWAAKNTKKEYAFDINGTWYGPEAEVQHSVTSGLYEEFGIGSAVTAQLSLSLYADDISKGATIKRYARLVNGEQVSEWLPKGEFFINRRAEDDGYWTVEAYDAMRKAETVWTPDQELEFPMPMPDAVAEFARIMGVAVDSRTVLNSSYTIDYPANDYTIRQELGYIAAAHGGNWIITDAGKLRLVPLLSETEENSHSVGLDITGFENNGQTKPISRVTLLADDENYYTAGNDTGLEIIADCPHATQGMTSAILTVLSGYQYQMYRADDANIDPAVELGDGISVGGIDSVIARIDDDGSGYISVSAPGEEELEDEYPAAGPMTQEINRKLAETRSSINKTAEEINLKIEATDGRVADITETVDSITLSVTSTSSEDGQTTAKITLQVGPNRYTGYIKMSGNVNVDGQLSADALYAALGDIADLTVDRLSTSRRIVKYLAGDQSDDNFVRIREQYIELVSGVYADGTEQAENPNGALLYWEADPEGASIASDGYPHVNGERIFTTTQETPWPVMVYTYNEKVKRSTIFEKQGDEYVPVDVFGAGNEDGSNQARMVKSANGLELTYTAPNGVQAGFIADTAGHLDFYGVRRTVGLNFAGWNSGSWRVRLEGLETALDYGVTLDDAGVPINITYPDGTQCPIYWTEPGETP